MAAAASQSVQAGVSDEDKHQTPVETKTVEEEKANDHEGFVVKVQQRPWTPLEDAKIIMHVAVHGEKMWSKISKQLPGRSFADCRVRWADHLTPCVIGSPFNNNEEMHLMVAHARGIKLKSSAAAAAACRPTADSSSVYPERSTVVSCKTASGSGKDILTWDSMVKCMACTFKWHSPVYEQRTFMADCVVCRKALAMGGGKVNAVRPPVFSFGRVNPMTTRNTQQPATIGNRPELPSSSAAPPPPPPPPASPSSRPPPKFIDFLGVGSE